MERIAHSQLQSGVLVFSAFIALLLSGPVAADLAVEKTGRSETLPSSYPNTWIFAHDTNFSAISDGKVVIVDVASKNRNHRGSIPAGQFASFLASSTRPELYVAETYYEKRVRGTRFDVITVYDKASLSPIAEIELPGGKRGQYVTFENTLQFLNGERWLAVYNFTPAASVYIVDIAQRKVISEPQVAGCSMIYPTGQRNFVSLCGDDTMLVTQLDDNAKVVKQFHTEKFFSADKDPLFMVAGTVGKVAYLPSFLGDIQPLGLSGDEPKILPRWSLLNDAERAENWRPGGWQMITADAAGHLYVLMHPNGYNGSHKSGGSEVWVFDAASGRRLARHVLKNWGISIEATLNDDPSLVVTNDKFQLDVYQAGSGQWVRMIGDHVAEMPLLLHAER